MITDKTKKYLLFFDLDGTLLFDNKIPEETRAMLDKVQAAGNKIILNTGRSKAFIPDEAKTVNWNGMVCGSAYVEYENEIVYSSPMKKELLLETAEYCIKNGIPLYFEGITELYTIGGPRLCQDITEDFREILSSGVEITKATVARPITDEENEFFTDKYHVIRLPTYTELLQPGLSKAYGMKLIAELERAERSEIIAFGDSLNDYDMLKYAGISVAIKHAPEEFDTFVSMRTGDSRLGVAQAIEALFFG